MASRRPPKAADNVRWRIFIGLQALEQESVHSARDLLWRWQAIVFAVLAGRAVDAISGKNLVAPWST